jgi:hypothetical protein
MLVKIGTLGKMKAVFLTLKIQQNHIIATMEVQEGVKYEIVAAVNYSEIWKIAQAMMKPSIIWYALSGWAKLRNSKPPKL